MRGAHSTDLHIILCGEGLTVLADRVQVPTSPKSTTSSHLQSHGCRRRHDKGDQRLVRTIPLPIPPLRYHKRHSPPNISAPSSAEGSAPINRNSSSEIPKLPMWVIRAFTHLGSDCIKLMTCLEQQGTWSTCQHLTTEGGRKHSPNSPRVSMHATVPFMPPCPHTKNGQSFFHIHKTNHSTRNEQHLYSE